MTSNYLEINKRLWDTKVPHHVNSKFYNNEAFIRGASSLKSIEIELLGDVKGKKILHLQCHFGQDSISLAKMGAEVTAVDFSTAAIKEANNLNSECQTKVNFICCDIYSLRDYCSDKFDIVFTSYGTIGWLPDMDRWAKVVSDFLVEGGTFLMVEFHPVVWIFNDEFSKIDFSYFNEEEIVEEIEGTYADNNAPISNKSISWNHPLSEVFSALINQSLVLEDFKEYDYSPYDCFQNTIEIEPGKWMIKSMENKLPMLYSMLWKK